MVSLIIRNACPSLIFVTLFSFSRWTPVAAQSLTPAPPASSQSTGFNSTFKLSQEQAESADLTPDQVESLENVYNVEYSQYAGGSTEQDPFYDISAFQNGTFYTPGTLLRVEDFTNITDYSLAANLAMSRILYVSRNLNGTAVPTSAFILWPFMPRQIPGYNANGAPVVVWNHPTTGWFGPSAPSKHRSLWVGDNAVFPLSLAGYAVVAPDFAGIGVNKDFTGNHLPHQYLAASVQAADGVFAFQAARTAFADRLSKDYVVFGQSQGAGSTWGYAELMERERNLSDGYLGAVTVSPAAEVFAGPPFFIGPFVGFGLSSIFPEFNASDWLTPFGQSRAKLLENIEGGLATAMYLLQTTQDVALPGLQDTWFAKAYSALANAGRKAISKPLLIIQSTNDAFVPFNVVVQNVNDTCTQFPDNQIQFQVVNGTGHVPTLDASQQIWTSWIEDRFMGKPVQLSGCGERSDLDSFLPIERYQATINSIVQWAGSPQYIYEAPLEL